MPDSPATPSGGPGATRPPAAAQAALAVLRERFAAATGETVAAVRALAGRLRADPDASEVLESLRRLVHRVHGTAATYGFAAASQLAAELEARVMAWATDPVRDRAERAGVVERFGDALERAFAAPDGPGAG